MTIDFDKIKDDLNNIGKPFGKNKVSKSPTTNIFPPPPNALSPYELEHILQTEKELHACLVIRHYMKTEKENTSYGIICLAGNDFFDRIHKPAPSYAFAHVRPIHISSKTQKAPEAPEMPNCIPLAKVSLPKSNTYDKSIFNKICNDTVSSYANLLTLSGIEITVKIETEEYHNKFEKKIFKPGSTYDKYDNLPCSLEAQVLDNGPALLNEPVSRFYEASELFLKIFQEFPKQFSENIEQQEIYYERIIKTLLCSADRASSRSHAADYILKEKFKNLPFQEFMPERAINTVQIHNICEMPIFEILIKSELPFVDFQEKHTLTKIQNYITNISLLLNKNLGTETKNILRNTQQILKKQENEIISNDILEQINSRNKEISQSTV